MKSIRIRKGKIKHTKNQNTFTGDEIVGEMSILTRKTSKMSYQSLLMTSTPVSREGRYAHRKFSGDDDSGIRG